MVAVGGSDPRYSMLAAIGFTSGGPQPWLFIVAAIISTLFVLACSAACGACSVFCCSSLPRCRLRRRLQILASIAIATVLYLAVAQYEASNTTSNFINQALQQVSFVRNLWLPPRWTQEAVSAAWSVVGTIGPTAPDWSSLSLPALPFLANGWLPLVYDN